MRLGLWSILIGFSSSVALAAHAQDPVSAGDSPPSEIAPSEPLEGADTQVTPPADFPPAELGATQPAGEGEATVAPDSSAAAAVDPPPTAADGTAAGSPGVPFIEPESLEDTAPPPVAGDAGLHVGALFGFGLSFDDNVGSINSLGFGIGVRGDYRLLDRLAVGGRFLYYFGGSAALPTGQVSMSSWILAAEVSHVLPASGLLVQPGVAIGLSGLALDGRVAADTGNGFIPGSEDRSEIGFYLGPGATVVLPFAVLDRDLDPFYVAADGRIGLVFRDSLSGSLELLAHVGARF